MKLQTKLSIVLLAALLITYFGSCLFLRSRSLGTIGQFSRENRAAEEFRQWAWVERLSAAVDGSLISAMNQGEMDEFTRILEAQRSVKGLQEISLHDLKGKVTHSSESRRIKQQLPADIQGQLLASPQSLKRRTADSFEIYQSLPATKSCVECHINWQPGQVCGVLAMRFSSEALKTAESAWAGFERDFTRANEVAVILTAVVFMIVLGLVVSLTLHYQLAVPLKRLAHRLWEESDQVSAAAVQVSISSRTVAEQASEQAASIEQTGASLEEMTTVTRDNTGHAQKAMELAQETHLTAERGAGHMSDLNATIQDINTSSDDIAKIIKTINEIAFQTNMLALNAAVEAARAGGAGMGFAVVAEEVRALAQRSAQAARESAARVEGALSKTARSAELSRKVQTTFDQILVNARGVDELDASLATASREQSRGIQQINQAVNQMDQITQANAAAAEEGAAAAEQLNAQAGSMKILVDELLGLVVGKGRAIHPMADESHGSSPRPEKKPDPRSQAAKQIHKSARELIQR